MFKPIYNSNVIFSQELRAIQYIFCDAHLSFRFSAIGTKRAGYFWSKSILLMWANLYSVTLFGPFLSVYVCFGICTTIRRRHIHVGSRKLTLLTNWFQSDVDVKSCAGKGGQFQEQSSHPTLGHSSVPLCFGFRMY